MSIKTQSNNVNGVSLYEVFDESWTCSKPLVILIHGFSGQKDEMLPWGTMFAESGYYTLLIDAYGHGERNTTGDLPTPLEAVLKTTDEINGLIEYYTKNKIIDSKRIGLAGGSMGGWITLNYITRRDRKVKAAASMLATPYWTEILGNPVAISLLQEKKPTYTNEIIDAELKLAEQIQPARSFGSLRDFPLLNINGGADVFVPTESLKQLIEYARSLYQDKSLIKMSIHPDTSHVFTSEMIQEVIQWFDLHL
ncbi:MAG TPA: alpha/beta fold hydrolase [Clostridiaceae bacterium]|nr:alpha/beta fold hydrolase [Clostridiaceae bacterium]